MYKSKGPIIKYGLIISSAVCFTSCRSPLFNKDSTKEVLVAATNTATTKLDASLDKSTDKFIHYLENLKLEETLKSINELLKSTNHTIQSINMQPTVDKVNTLLDSTNNTILELKTSIQEVRNEIKQFKDTTKNTEAPTLAFVISGCILLLGLIYSFKKVFSSIKGNK